MCPSSTQATHPSPHPSHFRLSLLAALHRNGLRWSRPRRSAHSQICGQQMPDYVSLHCHLFSHQYYFLWSTPEMFCLISIDCYYLFRFIKHQSGKKTSACVDYISSALCNIQVTVILVFFELEMDARFKSKHINKRCVSFSSHFVPFSFAVPKKC